jgi:hypothetical protein
LKVIFIKNLKFIVMNSSKILQEVLDTVMMGQSEFAREIGLGRSQDISKT